MKDFASDFSIFSGDAFTDDDSPPDEVLFDLMDFAGDALDDFIDGSLRLFCDGDFFAGDVFDGESFCVLPKSENEEKVACLRLKI